VTVDLSKLSKLPAGTKITGERIAEEATNQLIKSKFGAARGHRRRPVPQQLLPPPPPQVLPPQWSAMSQPPSLQRLAPWLRLAPLQPQSLALQPTSQMALEVGFDAVNKQIRFAVWHHGRYL
jgi:hypothetical protein